MPRVTYRDLPYALVGSLLIAHFLIGLNNDPFLVLIFRPFYWVELAIITLILFGLWQYVRFVSIRLDRAHPWDISPGRRFFLQASLGIGAAALLGLAVAAIYFRLVVGQDMREATFLTYEFPISLLILVLFNAFYFAYYHYQLSVQLRAELLALRAGHVPLSSPTVPVGAGEAPTAGGVILVNRGADQIPLPVADVRLVVKRGSLAYLYLQNGEAYATNQPLDDLQDRLPGDDFFRANRQAIVHRRACRAFQPIENGKLRVETGHEPLIISQKRAPVFRRWITLEEVD